MEDAGQSSQSGRVDDRDEEMMRLREQLAQLQRTVDILVDARIGVRTEEAPSLPNQRTIIPPRSDKDTKPKPPKPAPFDPSSKDANVRTWLFSLGNYFDALGTPAEEDQQRIAFAVTLLAGPALEWWRQMTLLAQRQGLLREGCPQDQVRQDHAPCHQGQGPGQGDWRPVCSGQPRVCRQHPTH